MVKRKIIEIDRDKCNGCGLCTTACAEGALVLDSENKAILVKELYCDGMGACLDVCPVDALHIIEKDSEAYNAQASYEHVLKTRGEEATKYIHGLENVIKTPPAQACGCPGSMAQEIKRTKDGGREQESTKGRKTENGNKNTDSELSQWPIQLHLISPYAPYFNGIDLLIAADCTAFSLGTFHAELLKRKKLVICCPKLDDTSPYVEKLTELIKTNTIYSITVAVMSVPCCSGLMRLVEQAVALSGKTIAIKKIIINLEGRIL